ncbi:MAG: hypothetical protein QXO71_11250, partial [Candidatus Jordarchaeaceae archaeon]
MYFIEEFDKFLVEVDWDFNNTPHGDDQVTLFRSNDCLFIILSDGVTTCTCGRLASIFVSHFIREYLEQNIVGEEKAQVNIEDLLLKSIRTASENLKMLHNHLKQEIAYYSLLQKISTESDTLFNIIQSFSDILTRISKLVEVRNWFENKYNQIKVKIDQLLKPLSESREATNSVDVDNLQITEELDDLKSRLLMEMPEEVRMKVADILKRNNIT